MALGRGTPILGAIVYPPHLLFVPPQLFGLNFMGALLVAMLVFQPLLLLAIVVPLHIYSALAYLRDPFLVGMLRGWALGRRLRALRTPMVLPAGGNLFVP